MGLCVGGSQVVCVFFGGWLLLGWGRGVRVIDFHFFPCSLCISLPSSNKLMMR